MNQINKLLEAAKYGDLEATKLLLNQDADPYAAGIALCYAANQGYIDIVKLLLDQGVNAQANNNLGLLWAADKGHFEIMVLLVEHGANYKVLSEFRGMKCEQVVEQLVARAVAKEAGA